MDSPKQHIFGLGLTLEADSDAAHANDDGLGLFGDACDVGVGCGNTDPERQGTEDVSFNQDIFINSQIQLLIRDETPRLPSNNSPDIQQQPAIRSESPISPLNNSSDIQQHPIIIQVPRSPPFIKSPDIQQQSGIRNESPQIPSNNPWGVQQQPITGNEPTASPFNNYDSCGTEQQPIIIKETPELLSDNSWDNQQQHVDVVNAANSSQPLLGDVYNDVWDLPSPSDPIWSLFTQGPFQPQTSNDASNHETIPGAYGEHIPQQHPLQTQANNGTSDQTNPGAYVEHNPGQPSFQNQTDISNSNHETNLGVTNEYNPGFAEHSQIPQAQASYINQDIPHTTQPQQGSPPPISQGISSDTINELSELHPLRQYLAQSSQQPQGSLKRVAEEEYIPVPNYAPILQKPSAKRLKTNNGTAVPVPRKVKVNNGGVNVNPRTARRIELDPTQYYQPLAQTPQSWGTINPDGRHRFRYNGFGELKPGMTFTSEEMLEYLIVKFPRTDNLKSNNPSLFIQCVPSDSNSRYPTTISNKCRFTDCPVKMRTIPSGHFRVAFDEQNNENLDPYHCAGYVHLYCLERFCSFSCLAEYCNFVPDTRELREGRNRMSITRDHSEFARMCMVYMENSRQLDPHALGWEYRNTLCSLLTGEYLRLEARVRRATRERQGGNNIGVHGNDMELYAWGQEHKVLLRAMAAQNRPKKRKRCFDEEEED
ncbi:hypothetical protein V499_06388 [Pseudogymnoascus sp. VKM F-103]|nr:hypothetical protein V499_06388 [Pseudogymnoascus sp. VKM F-103]